jgi:hypothetical protein
MLSHQGKQRIVWGFVLAAWLGGFAVAGSVPDRGTRAEARLTTGGSADRTTTPAPQSVTQSIMQDGGSGSGVDPTIERGSRGVARNLLLAGIGVAVVIAVLSGVFAFRHKKQ